MDWFLYDNGLRHERVKHIKSLNGKTYFKNFAANASLYFRELRSLSLLLITSNENFANLTGKHLCWNLFLIKLQA